MGDPECHGSHCKFTGGPNDSPATPGKCTATGGYISDAEINEILKEAETNKRLKRSSRVQHHYLDEDSDTDILVYDDNQWVGYMNPDTKARRAFSYLGLHMGGFTDWDTDLKTYNDPPTRGGVLVKNWGAWKASI